MLIDCHNHSFFSYDAECSVSEMCSAAAEKGISVYAISDHCDVNDYEKKNLKETVPKSFEAISEAKKTSKIKLLCGIEMGQPMQAKDKAEKILSSYPYDMVIGSIHNIKNEEDFYYIDYSKLSDSEIKDLLSRYYQEIFETAKWGKYDTMAHIVYPYRYMTGERAGRALRIDFKAYDDIVAEAYKILVKNGKAIEVNSSSGFLRDEKGGEMMRHYLALFKGLGGEFVTVGADAHTTKDVGKDVCFAYEMIKEAGFSHVTYFEKRKPVAVKL